MEVAIWASKPSKPTGTFEKLTLFGKFHLYGCHKPFHRYLLSYPFGKESNQKKYLSAIVQLLERYATQLFDNNWLVGRVHFNVTPCDVWCGNSNEDNDDVDEMM